MEEARRFEEARMAEEAALAMVEMEKAKCRAAMEKVEAAQRMAVTGVLLGLNFSPQIRPVRRISITETLSLKSITQYKSNPGSKYQTLFGHNSALRGLPINTTSKELPDAATRTATPSTNQSSLDHHTDHHQIPLPNSAICPSCRLALARLGNQFPQLIPS